MLPLLLQAGIPHIAKQYENNKYTIAARHMGFNGQTEYITDTSKFALMPPWDVSNSDNSNETVGGGDILFDLDYRLVLIAVENLAANKAGTTEGASYWLASRDYRYDGPTIWGFYGRLIDSSGQPTNGYLYYYYDGYFSKYTNGNSIRPIITIKSGVSAVGSGTKEDPWILS